MLLGSIGKQKVDADEARRINNEDNRVYSAAGRYDEFGRFILTDNLKTKAGMVSAEYAQIQHTDGNTGTGSSTGSLSSNMKNRTKRVSTIEINSHDNQSSYTNE